MSDNTGMEYQKAIRYIIQMIQDGKLIVGSKIPSERDLAELLGIGRNSTREAISILRGLGLVESRHGSGNYISRESGKSIRTIVSVMLALHTITKKDVLEMRRCISHSVAMLLIGKGISEKHRVELFRIVERMKEAPESEFVELDKEFHLGLIRATENDLFRTIVEPIGEIYLEIIAEVVEQTDAAGRKELAGLHAAILQNIEGKDRDGCENSIKKHYDFVERKLK